MNLLSSFGIVKITLVHVSVQFGTWIMENCNLFVHSLNKKHVIISIFTGRNLIIDKMAIYFFMWNIHLNDPGMHRLTLKSPRCKKTANTMKHKGQQAVHLGGTWSKSSFYSETHTVMSIEIT